MVGKGKGELSSSGCKKLQRLREQEIEGTHGAGEDAIRRERYWATESSRSCALAKIASYNFLSTSILFAIDVASFQ
jgi:hypothetical protein